MAKGEDAKFLVMQNGKEIASFYSLESITVSFGFTVDMVDYVGADASEIDENNGPATLNWRFNPKSTDYQKFVDYRRRRALPVGHPKRLENITFAATMRVNHGDGGTDRYKFPDLKIGDANVESSGRTPRVSGNVTAYCARPETTL